MTDIVRLLIKKIVPTFILDYIRKQRYSKLTSPYKENSVNETFELIYEKNIWQSDISVSGPGSSKKLSKNAIEGINGIILQYKINAILDLPCGDFNWMKWVDLSKVDYIGADIVKELIASNVEKYGASNIHFQPINIIEDELPTSDLVIVRDCLVHFSYQHIFKSIANIKKIKIYIFTYYHI